jgi:hypothetical protein
VPLLRKVRKSNKFADFRFAELTAGAPTVASRPQLFEETLVMETIAYCRVINFLQIFAAHLETRLLYGFGRQFHVLKHRNINIAKNRPLLLKKGYLNQYCSIYLKQAQFSSTC